MALVSLFLAAVTKAATACSGELKVCSSAARVIFGSTNKPRQATISHTRRNEERKAGFMDNKFIWEIMGAKINDALNHHLNHLNCARHRRHHRHRCMNVAVRRKE